MTLEWMIRAARGNDLAARLLKVSFLATMYYIWMERTSRWIKNKSSDIHIILTKVCKKYKR